MESTEVVDAKNDAQTTYADHKTWLITGGPGPERDGSLISGRHVSEALDEIGVAHEVVDLVSIADAEIRHGDVAFITTHGQWGEDGKLQGFLETLRVRYTGSGVLGAAIAMHKAASNRAAEALGAKVPAWIRVTETTPPAAVEAFIRDNGPRTIMRPASGGGSRGIIVAETPAEILHALEVNSWDHMDYILSAFIEGTEVSVACIQEDGQIDHLPILQTEYNGAIYDYTIKHDHNLRRHTCPAELSERVADSIRATCAELYRALDLCGFARFDFLVSDDGSAWFLEVNTLPGMARTGNLATMASAAGIEYRDLVLRQFRSARSVDGYRS